LQTTIITGDLDALQLVNDRVNVLTLKRGFNDTITYDLAAVKERYGLKPKQLIDFKAIQGDASDNIKGVRGIGEKGALDLIKQFGDLKNLYSQLKNADLKERTRQLLTEQKKEAFESQKLVTIVQDVPLKWSLDEATFSDFDPEKVYRVFQKLEFNSLLKKIPHQQSGVDNNPLTLNKENDYQLINNSKDFEKFYQQLKKQKLIAVDSETSSLDVLTAEILGLSFSWQAKNGFYINFKNNDLKKLAMQKLKPLLEDRTIAKVGHNTKFEYKVFKVLNINFQGVVFDTMLAGYLINLNMGLRLEELSFNYLGYKKLKLADLLEKKPKKKNEINVNNIPLAKLAWYAAEDADITLRLYHKLLPIIKDNKNFDLLQKIELPLAPILAQIELNGVDLDIEFLHKMEKEFTKEIKKISQKIFKSAGQEFNISSPLQLKEVLFEKLDISSAKIKKTKTGLSTAAAELDKMKNSHPIIPLIIEYRELTKLQSTYITALPELINKKTHRLHTNFNQTITATGRLSSSNPNLQNIPIRTALGRQIRHAFVAPKNSVLLSVDYSQIELRLAAAISKDPKMMASFKKGEDIHARTAAEIHKIPLEKVTKEIRRTAKEVNFGVLYGLGSLGLAQRTDLNRNEAKEFIVKYFDIYKNIKKYIDHTKQFAHRHGYAQTLFGRRRYLPEINSSMPMLRATAERMAINMPLQGTAADLMKMAMIKVNQDLPKISSHTKIVLQVHDELVLEVPQTDIDQVVKFTKKTMENIYQLPIPLVVDAEVGANWGQLKHYLKK